jgi:hypothetical protein
MSTTPTERLFAAVHEHGHSATALVVRALTVASRTHHGQFSQDGSPRIMHVVAVAATVAELGADVTKTTAMLLHEVPDAVLLRTEFGNEVAELVSAFAAIDHSRFFDDRTPVDPRVLTLKIAHRLHTMQTLRGVEMALQQRKAAQTHRTVVPIARALGLAAIADELDELATLAVGTPITGAWPAPDRSGVATGVLRAAARVLLPDRCRDRWLAEWNAELHALPSRCERLAFVRNLLLGLPALAVHARRTRYADHGDRS